MPVRTPMFAVRQSNKKPMEAIMDAGIKNGTNTMTNARS